MEPLIMDQIRKTIEIQELNENQIMGDLSCNEMDLDAAFPSQVIWTAEIHELKRFSFAIPIEATVEERQYHSVKQELYDSERIYLKFMLTIQRYFMDALEDTRTSSKNTGIKKINLREIFSEIPTIYNINKELLREMRVSNVHTAFMKMSPFLKSYSTYARNYPNVIKAYDELSASSDTFNEVVTRQQNKPPCQGNSLMALMIMPVQRIPRYILLLTKMVEYSPCPQERKKLEEVLEKLNEIAELTESCIRDYENQQQLYRIQRDLGRPIVAPGRRIIKEGPLYKISQSSDVHDERMFWLFNDIIVYGKRRFITPKFSCSCIIPLKHCRLVYNELEGSLLIYCKDHCVMVTSDNYETLKEWNVAINTAVERINILRSTLRKESSKQPVRNFKNKLVKKFTNKFTKKTYPVNDEEDSETPIFRTDSEKTPNTKQKKYRKRKADLAFENELKEVLEKRRITHPDPSTPVVKSNKFDCSITNVSEEKQSEEYESRAFVCSAKSFSKATYSQLTIYETSPYKTDEHDENIPTSAEKLHDQGVDECDRVPRRKGAVRKIISERNKIDQTALVFRNTPIRVLSQPEIRLYSYQEPTTPAVESPSHSNDSSFEFDPERSRIAREKAIPWWVAEAAPAVYTQKKRTGFLENVRSNCSLM